MANDTSRVDENIALRIDSEHAGLIGDAAGEADSKLEDAIALCLSGGGYRAMIFHVGTLWRLNDAGVLAQLSRVSCVSGGSITGAVLALSWPKLAAGAFSRAAFIQHVVTPLRRMAATNVDAESILIGMILPGVTVGDMVAREYRKVLFGNATLQSLPDSPRFIFNATNVQSGSLVRFSKPYIWDWRVGKVSSPRTELAVAVGASSAFPPVLSPVTLKFKESDFEPNSGRGLQRPPFTTRMVLTDGGVYDNLALETALKRCRTLLVSDAGGQMQADGDPAENWASHSKRVLDLVDNQVRSLRKRQLLDAFTSTDADHRRAGAFWSVRSDIANYGLSDAFPAPFERTQELARIPTRLDALPDTLQERLINWGYAITDAAIRKHWDPAIAKPADLPYPGAGI
ncbi:MAG: patatin-like phospholipase family protein [Phycisphaerales bacterium]|jgi:NTE family protein|nr:patatin-like phospholipase family protein [Phycisphaerales bacterium]